MISTVHLQNTIDTFVFLRLVNTFNAVKDNFLGVEHNIFNILVPRPEARGCLMTNVCAYWFYGFDNCMHVN